MLAPDEPPALAGVLETALYVDDMERARDFYERILGLKPLTVDERLSAYAVGDKSVLLLFRRGSTLETVNLPGGTIPPHDGAGPAHLAFAVSVEALTRWEARLTNYGIVVEGRTEWPRGGQSIYVRDPDRHLVEFATPGIWAIY